MKNPYTFLGSLICVAGMEIVNKVHWKIKQTTCVCSYYMCYESRYSLGVKEGEIIGREK